MLLGGQTPVKLAACTQSHTPAQAGRSTKRTAATVSCRVGQHGVHSPPGASSRRRVRQLRHRGVFALPRHCCGPYQHELFALFQVADGGLAARPARLRLHRLQSHARELLLLVVDHGALGPLRRVQLDLAEIGLLDAGEPVPTALGDERCQC